jgi:hypothetical protein
VTPVNIPLKDSGRTEKVPGKRKPICKSSLSVSRFRKSYEKDNFRIIVSVPTTSCTAPAVMSQSLTVLSPDIDVNIVLSGENAIALTQAKWPLNVPRPTLVVAS